MSSSWSTRPGARSRTTPSVPCWPATGALTHDGQPRRADERAARDEGRRPHRRAARPGSVGAGHQRALGHPAQHGRRPRGAEQGCDAHPDVGRNGRRYLAVRDPRLDEPASSEAPPAVIEQPRSAPEADPGRELRRLLLLGSLRQARDLVPDVVPFAEHDRFRIALRPRRDRPARRCAGTGTSARASGHSPARPRAATAPDRGSPPGSTAAAVFTPLRTVGRLDREMRLTPATCTRDTRRLAGTHPSGMWVPHRTSFRRGLLRSYTSSGRGRERRARRRAERPGRRPPVLARGAAT